MLEYTAMLWENTDNNKPIKFWSKDIDSKTLRQAANLANHPKTFRHVALMADCHAGYGMPIGGVIACIDAVIPYAVGVDIGCGVCAVKTDIASQSIDRRDISKILELVKRDVPLGFSVHKSKQSWDGFEVYLNTAGTHCPLSMNSWSRALLSLGTLGGGNHFIEIQAGDDGFVWLMVHSGSRNLGKELADYYHSKAVEYCRENKIELPDNELAFLEADSHIGRLYIRDMNFALSFARENRKRIMNAFKSAFSIALKGRGGVGFEDPINIHHNYAALENHFGRDVWVHRKGATSACRDQICVIPGSMGTASYIARGLGSTSSFCSCSHGAGRRLGRNEAIRQLDPKSCAKQMDGIVFGGWNKITGGKLKGSFDVSESPAAYKDIEDVMQNQIDLVEPLVKLRPLGVIKG